jgi:hypothetical protein
MVSGLTLSPPLLDFSIDIKPTQLQPRIIRYLSWIVSSNEDLLVFVCLSDFHTVVHQVTYIPRFPYYLPSQNINKKVHGWTNFDAYHCTRPSDGVH